eukprot:2060508-Pyramimonas_sp.AAC.1
MYFKEVSSAVPVVERTAPICVTLARVFAYNRERRGSPKRNNHFERTTILNRSRLSIRAAVAS